MISDNFDTGILDPLYWAIDTGTSPAAGSGNVGQFFTSFVDMSQGMMTLKMNQTASVTNTVYNDVDQFPSTDFTTGCNPSSTQHWCGQHDAGTPGTATVSGGLVTTPAINGHARQFTCTFTSNGGCRFSAHLNPSDTTSTDFTYNDWVSIPSPTSINQLEQDMNQGIALNQLVIYGFQCNFPAGVWDITQQSGGSATWTHTAVACTRAQFTAGFHHIVLKAHRSADLLGNVTYDSIEFDGTKTNLGTTVNSLVNVSWASGAKSLNFQFNGNGSGSATVYASLFGTVDGVAGANYSSLGAEVRSTFLYNYGTFSCTMRASSTSVTPLGAGTEASGSVSSCFILQQSNGIVAPNYTEIDSPEFEGQGSPGLTGCTVGTVCAEFTNWTQPDGSHNTNVNSVVSDGDTAFHTYTWVWSPGKIIYKIDGSTVGTKTTFVPSAPAYVIFNHYGTNSASFGGTATAGSRYQYISNFTYTP